MSEITFLLQRFDSGDTNAADRLLPLVYHELRRLAAAKMACESGYHTLQPTALVHEAWLRLGADAQPRWENRGHFFAAAAETMRRILIDRARRRRASRHGGGLERVDVTTIEIPCPHHRADDQMFAVHEALEKFAQEEPLKAELVKLRYFGGLTLEEAASALNIPEGTAKRWWTYARAKLYQELKPERVAPSALCASAV